MISRLDSLLGEQQVSTREADLLCYGFDASQIKGTPVAVTWPETINDIVKISRFSYDHDIALLPRGAGTATTGSSVPPQGAIVVSLERMHDIDELNIEDQYVVVQPGIINGALQKELSRHGYFYPPDPSSLNFCTIGGNVATNAGGPRAIKYGVTRNYVKELEAVLPDGRIIRTGAKTIKSVVGYDIKDLLVGSEGTLAIIARITLSILPEPETIVTLLATFTDLEPSGKAVFKIISSGIVPRCLEFMDREAIKVVESYSPTGLSDSESLLIIELDGDVKSVQRDSERVVRIIHTLKGEVKVAEDSISRERIWKARRAIPAALFSIADTKINEDIVVPRSQIPEMIVFLRRLSEESGISIVSFGHAGDGNIHVNIMVNREDEERYTTAKALVKRIFEKTLSLGGTISGEHGIGITKAEYINMEIGHNEMDLMRGIKRLFDYKNLLNPGKIFP
ncbi:MAG: FAD-binding protein [Nitrospirae bacterium]|nr:FAD-binding protein [Nitrospirota bacterium]